MELLKQATQWAEGDALQGKIMALVGILLLAAVLAILRTDNALLRGMLIPLGVIILFYVGYGGFLALRRPVHVQTLAQRVEKSPEQALALELEKANRDNRAYSLVLKVWPVLIALCGLALLFVTQPYYRGLLIGLMGLFLALMVLDTFLHQRLQPYLEFLGRSME